jgi:hypothetical protein
MARKRHSDEDILKLLREIESAGQSADLYVHEFCNSIGQGQT